MLLGIVTLAHAELHAETIFNVDTVADEIDSDSSDGQCRTPTNVCSLRAAIMQANQSTVPLTRINLPAGTYVLARPPTGSDGEDSGDLNLAVPRNPGQTIDIVGAGSASTIVDANQSDSVIYVAPTRIANFSGVTIRNGYRNNSGGGIVNYGALTITDSTIEGNHGYFGGGILNQGTNTVSIVRCVIQNNSAHTGAGIDNEGTLNLDHSIIRSNVAEYQGGGLYVGVYAYATVRDSNFSENNAQFGGGIYNDDNHQNRVFIVASTLSENWASDSGGGIENAGYLYVVSSTISSDYANKNGGGIGNSYAAFLYNTSVIGNDADHDRDENGGIGGGVYIGSFSQFTAVNSLIAANTVGNTPIYDDCDGIVQVYGWNLFGEIAGCTFTGNGAAAFGLVSLNTIGPLQDNGGPTPTHALLPGSEAIDSTTLQGCVDQNVAPLTTDQRGAPRVAGAQCDVGAFEYGATPPSDLIFKNGFD
jgi:CSLREA domain-containing protein